MFTIPSQIRFIASRRWSIKWMLHVHVWPLLTLGELHYISLSNSRDKEWARFLFHFRLRSQHVVMASSNRTTFRVTGLSCGEFTGHRWIGESVQSSIEFKARTCISDYILIKLWDIITHSWPEYNGGFLCILYIWSVYGYRFQKQRFCIKGI